ncbi:hypothetical protein GCM10027275_33730 [Rhabdobacter roseus]|uniref:VIT1/CCC1 family predicted Fe2+/Mn2+ transporter n=1 Tax=Rhabdobacter roseus TaxID=1655419 RepID=A0A840TPZ0_9BACT|nr:hypothetical protein [Rhabdobacter roseus]MBB5285404.1 VIT1/CCC1 family predicted Fe2+/Mn2+ transporter [Rhabdobacter roseus]
MQNETNPPAGRAPVGRPLFLTVLCVLTFISCVSGLWTQSERLWSPGVVADQTRELFEQLRENMEERAAGENAELMDTLFDSVFRGVNSNNIQMSAILMLIYESLTLYGAYLMWNLQKTGFYCYLAGVVVILLAPLFLIGGWFGVVTSLGGGFFSLIFTGLYALNLKHLYS